VSQLQFANVWILQRGADARYNLRGDKQNVMT
jgi:hypothetical protein